MQRSARTAAKARRDSVEMRNIQTIIRHTMELSLVCPYRGRESRPSSSDSQSSHRQSDGVTHRAQTRIKVIASRSSRNKPGFKKQTTKTGKKVRDVHPCRMLAPSCGGMAARSAAECLALASPYHLCAVSTQLASKLMTALQRPRQSPSGLVSSPSPAGVVCWRSHVEMRARCFGTNQDWRPRQGLF